MKNLTELVDLPLNSTENWCGTKKTLHQNGVPCATARRRFFHPEEFTTSHASFRVEHDLFRVKEQGSFVCRDDDTPLATFSVQGLASLIGDMLRTRSQNIRIGKIECATGETYEIVGWSPEPHTSMFRVGNAEHRFIEVNQNEETIWIRELPEDLKHLSIMLSMAWRWIELPSCDP